MLNEWHQVKSLLYIDDTTWKLSNCQLSNQIIINYKGKDTVCPRSSDPFYVKTYYIYSIVYSDPFYVETYYIKWVILGHSSIQLNF